MICPYLNTKRSTQEPNQDVINGGERREYVMTKFAINTNVIRISYVPYVRQATNRESHSPLLSHTIFVLVPIYTLSCFSKSNDSHSMMSVGGPVAFMKYGRKKGVVAHADLSVPPCSKNVYNV